MYKIAIRTKSMALKILKIIFKSMAEGFDTKLPDVDNTDKPAKVIIKIAGII